MCEYLRTQQSRAQMSLIQELKRRNVIRVGVLYLVAAWLLLQLTDPCGLWLLRPRLLNGMGWLFNSAEARNQQYAYNQCNPGRDRRRQDWDAAPAPSG